MISGYKKKRMKRFIGEKITVRFSKNFILEKDPPCPKAIQWRGEEIQIEQLIHQWRDFSRSGNDSRNMRETHLNRAKKKGSWGVGKIFFEVEDVFGRYLVIYYDRAPKNTSDRKGQWTLFSITEK